MRGLLYSGGMDSWIINKLLDPEILIYFNMNTRYSQMEIERLPKETKVIDLDLSYFERDDKIIPMRNLILVSLASIYADEIIIGATSGDRVLDKSDQFGFLASNLLSYLWQPQHWTEGKSIRVRLPFKHHSKTQMVLLLKEKGLPIEEAFHESFSCYDPSASGDPCWRCKPCLRKWVAFKNNGYDHKCIAPEIIKKQIMPQIRMGIWRSAQEDRDIRRAMGEK